MRSLYCPLYEDRVWGYHLPPKIVSSVRGFRWKIPISVSLGVSSILRALEAKGWVEREHSKTDRRRVHVTVTDKGFQDLEIKRREFEKRTAAFLEQLGETDTQEMVRLLRRANEIIDRNQERRDAE